MLAMVVFEEAILQHNFLRMYADLCLRLIDHFGEEGWMLRDHLWEQCWMSFQVPVTENPGPEQMTSLPPSTSESEGQFVAKSSDGVEDVGDARKKRLLGSVRFMGELFVRSLLDPYGIITWACDLLQPPLYSDNVELAVAFLTVVGPVFDCAEWPHFPELRAIFWDLRGMTFDHTLAPRVRFLIRDIIELRDHGWLDTRYATHIDRPKRLDDVRWEAAAESKPADTELTAPREKTSADTPHTYPDVIVQTTPSKSKRGSNIIRPGDWTCHFCGLNVFASRASCFKCGTAWDDSKVPVSRSYQ
jgi:hypothetical protein